MIKTIICFILAINNPVYEFVVCVRFYGLRATYLKSFFKVRSIGQQTWWSILIVTIFTKKIIIYSSSKNGWTFINSKCAFSDYNMFCCTAPLRERKFNLAWIEMQWEYARHYYSTQKRNVSGPISILQVLISWSINLIEIIPGNFQSWGISIRE